MKRQKMTRNHPDQRKGSMEGNWATTAAMPEGREGEEWTRVPYRMHARTLHALSGSSTYTPISTRQLLSKFVLGDYTKMSFTYESFT